MRRLVLLEWGARLTVLLRRRPESEYFLLLSLRPAIKR